MKQILMSIRPQWVAKILNGDKSIEVRKGTTLYEVINKLIKEQGKAPPCLIYCTKAKPYLFAPNGLNEHFWTQRHTNATDTLNGKVVAMFEASAEVIKSNRFSSRFTKTMSAFELEKRSCLTQMQIADYLVDDDNSPVLGTAIHIHSLKTFDKPKELKDFGQKRAPQSWCYVEVDE